MWILSDYGVAHSLCALSPDSNVGQYDHSFLSHMTRRRRTEGGRWRPTTEGFPFSYEACFHGGGQAHQFFRVRLVNKDNLL